MVDAGLFARERQCLAGLWTFLGFSTEVARDGDWIVRDLWGHSVFVQRCGRDLRGFENRCAHRFFPLRTKPAGNGPIRCGFHGWRYDGDGRAVDIPLCAELFGRSPRELNARLAPIELDLCGPLIFGRIAALAQDKHQSLGSYLGDMGPVLAAMSQEAVARHPIDCRVAANWKLAYHISLDDYHIVAVHPSTFGSSGPLHSDDFRYYRCGPHSAMFNSRGLDDVTFAKIVAGARGGRYAPEGYRIFHLFPNLALVQYRLLGRWYVLVMQYVAAKVDETIIRTWSFSTGFGTRRTGLTRTVDCLLDIPRALALRCGIRKVVGEDAAICEQLQGVAHQSNRRPYLGAQETRIAWFDEAYACAMNGVLGRETETISAFPSSEAKAV